jgi:hypothetical protein
MSRLIACGSVRNVLDVVGVPIGWVARRLSEPERVFGLQRGYGSRAQTEPLAQHLLRVLSQHGRRRDSCPSTIDAHGQPGSS